MKTNNFRLIDHGNKSQIFLYENRLILKMVNSKRREQIKHLLNQFEMMKSIQHPNILKVVSLKHDVPVKNASNSTQDCRRDVLVMEYANKGSLIGVLKEGIEIEEKKRVVRELAKAFCYLHEEEGVAHRDVKLDNILMKKEEGGTSTVLVSDFGFAIRRPKQVEGLEKLIKGKQISTEFEKSSNSKNNLGNISKSKTTTTLSSFHHSTAKSKSPFLTNSCKGTKQVYMAPQLHSLQKGSSYDPFKVDVFSLAVVIFSIFFVKFPFQISIKTKDPVFKLIAERRYPEFWAKLSVNQIKYPHLNLEELKNLLERMFEADPEQRITMRQVLDSEFIQSLKQPKMKNDIKVDKLEVEKNKQQNQFTSNSDII